MLLLTTFSNPAGLRFFLLFSFSEQPARLYHNTIP